MHKNSVVSIFRKEAKIGWIITEPSPVRKHIITITTTTTCTHTQAHERKLADFNFGLPSSFFAGLVFCFFYFWADERQAMTNDRSKTKQQQQKISNKMNEKKKIVYNQNEHK